MLSVAELVPEHVLQTCWHRRLKQQACCSVVLAKGCLIPSLTAEQETSNAVTVVWITQNWLGPSLLRERASLGLS